ncbi:MAG: putative beta-lactamase, partial [Frankiales bacterium]|nr:putative beta-lactamase [Frankiales bacterium]
MRDLADLIRELAEKHDVPGLATAVLHRDQTQVAVHGVTSATDPLPVDEDTMFFIGSTTKTLTATALMTFVESGALSLDAAVNDVLPGCAVLDEVTVGMLLDHTAGFRGDSLVDTGWGDDCLARVVDECLPHEPQVTAPGAVVSYNNAAVVVAGRLLEVLSGRPYPAALAATVLEPLGMTSSTLLPWEATGRRLATGHLSGSPVLGWPVKRSWGPAGGLASSIGDQVRWARFCLDGGP